jgi:hypothetical protein
MQSILAHFKQDFTYTVIYNTFIWISFIPTLIIYFRLICIQLNGLLGEHSFISVIVFIMLFVLILAVRLLDVAEKTMALGFVSIATYLLFLCWAQITAP